MIRFSKGCVMSLAVFGLIACNPSGPTSGGGQEESLTLTSVAATSNTEVVVSFNRAVKDDFSDIRKFVIVPDNGTNAVLPVVAATPATDHLSVTLKTTSQAQQPYSIKVVGATADDAIAEFTGLPPSQFEITLLKGEDGPAFWYDINNNSTVDVGDAITNSAGDGFGLIDANTDGIVDNWQDKNGDGEINAGDIVAGFLDNDFDGLQDSRESLGWPVTIEDRNYVETTYFVSSDPLKADTDGDGLNDFFEFSELTDPRNADSDADSLSDYREVRVIFSKPTKAHSDADGLADGDEVNNKFTSPTLTDTDGDNISDDDEIDQNRNPRIADRPNFRITVDRVNLWADVSIFDEATNTSSYSDELNYDVTLSRSQSESYSHTDSVIDQTVGKISSQLAVEASYESETESGIAPVPSLKQTTKWGTKISASVGGGKEWTNAHNWQTTRDSASSAEQAYSNSVSKAKEYITQQTQSRQVEGGIIKTTVDIYNDSNFTLTFNNIQISVLQTRSGELEPITTLTMSNGPVTISPLSSSNLGGDLIFENTNASELKSQIEYLMRNVDTLVFQVTNYDITDSNGNLFTHSDQSVFNSTAGVVIDYGNNANAERFLVSTAGSQDSQSFVDGEWQGGSDKSGKERGVSLSYVMQSILGLERHYAFDTIHAGDNGTLDTIVLEGSDDEMLGGIILPGANGWLETQPEGDDIVLTKAVDKEGNEITKQGVLAGPDGVFNEGTVAFGDDIANGTVGTKGLPYGAVIISAGNDGVLDENTTIDPLDLLDYIDGFQTRRTCTGNSQTTGDICTVNRDCFTEEVEEGQCNGPERISRIKQLSSGDFNRDWFVFVDESMPTEADFNAVKLKAGNRYSLAFLQDLDRDGIVSRVEALYGSADSAANIYDNAMFGPGFDVVANAGQTNGDIWPDSRDTDHDGLDDYSEIYFPVQVNTEDKGLIDVYSRPYMADSDNDGLYDIEERDLRQFCTENDPRTDALCRGYINNSDYIAWATSHNTKQQAIGIIAGPNGTVDSVLSGGDIELYAQGTENLRYGTAVIVAGVDESSGELLPLATTISGDDRYLVADDYIPATNPLAMDTDNDGVSDYDELYEYLAAGALVTKGSETDIVVMDVTAQGDDVQLAGVGESVTGGVKVIGFGENQLLESNVSASLDILAAQTYVTDPLRSDFDSDGTKDGFEFKHAGDPTLFDGISSFDSDGDGLPDAIEESGWDVVVIEGEVVNNRLVRTASTFRVTSDPFVTDSDDDGLSDAEEYHLVPKTNPNEADTDGDGLSDFYEVFGYEKDDANKAPWSIEIKTTTNGSAERIKLIHVQGAAYVTNPANTHTDNDYSSDFDEVDMGTNPQKQDTDGDGLGDYYEVLENISLTINGVELPDFGSDPTDSDADNDGLNDFDEKQFGAHPGKADTDEDLRLDLDESLLGTDPANTDKCVRVSIARLTHNGDKDKKRQATIRFQIVRQNSNGADNVVLYDTTQQSTFARKDFAVYHYGDKFSDVFPVRDTQRAKIYVYAAWGGNHAEKTTIVDLFAELETTAAKEKSVTIGKIDGLELYAVFKYQRIDGPNSDIGNCVGSN